MSASNSTFPNNIKVIFIYIKTIPVDVGQWKQSLFLRYMYVKSGIIFSGNDLGSQHRVLPDIKEFISWIPEDKSWWL